MEVLNFHMLIRRVAGEAILLSGGLLKQLADKPQREVAGSDTASRFDYQKNWAFCEMLDRHMQGADYLVAFEFHDDVVFLSPSEEPNKTEFAQVKTSRSQSPRKLSSLLSRRAENNSILGKMCMNFEGICKEFETSVILVSNIPFEFSTDSIRAVDLDEKQRSRIVEKLSDELGYFTEDSLQNLYFCFTGVSVDQMSTFLQGKALELFKFALGESHGVNVHGWVRLIQDEIGRKNNFPSDKISSPDELINRKCIGREFVNETISAVSKHQQAKPDFTYIGQVLTDSGWTANDVMRLQKKLPNALSDHYDPTNKDVAAIATKLGSLYHASSKEQDVALPAFLEAIKEQAAEISGDVTIYNDQHYLCALGVIVFHEKL